MIKNDRTIQKLIYGDVVEKLAEDRKISLEEARRQLYNMSFTEYMILTELVTPPSGQTIGPTGTTTTPGFANLAKPSPMAPAAALSKGQAAASGGLPTPPEIGGTYNVPGPNNLPVPVQITRVDKNNNTVRYKSPITGRDEDIGMDKLTPATAGNSSPEAKNAVAGDAGQVAEELTRLRQLAGISENCSAGATGAGAIAVAPAAMGTVKKRQPTEEARKKEYVRTEPAKSIIGDTKPNQASGELSANNQANGIQSASRKKRVK